MFVLLVITFIVFISSIIYFKDDEKILYKLFSILFIFNLFVLFFKYTKTLGEKLEKKENEIALEKINEKLKEQEEDYENYVKNQVSQIVWKIPQ